MRYVLHIFLLILGLTVPAVASGPKDSTIYRSFQKIAGKLRLTHPQLRKDEYEIRIWQKQALMFGDAHLAYIVTKTSQKLAIAKYLIVSNKRGFRYFTRFNPTSPLSPAL